jgi:hypothetical protein
MPEQIFMKLGMSIMAPKPISVVYFINPISLCVCVSPLSLIGNGSLNSFLWWGIHKTKKNCWTCHFLWDPYKVKEGSVCLSLYRFIVTREWLGEHFLTAMKNCWRHRFLWGLCHVEGK